MPASSSFSETPCTPSAVISKLAAGDDEDVVKAQIHREAGQGISGVPFFIVNGEYGILRAQPADTMIVAFDQISAA